MKNLHISWREISRICHSITTQVTRPTHIVALSRGGLTPGVMLSHHWDIPLIPLQWSTRDHAQQELGAATGILSLLSQNPQAQILILDDIGDTGKTLESLTNFLYNHMVTDAKDRITTACLFLKPQCSFTPDVYGDEIPEQDTWVVFPFEEPLEEK